MAATATAHSPLQPGGFCLTGDILAGDCLLYCWLVYAVLTVGFHAVSCKTEDMWLWLASSGVMKMKGGQAGAGWEERSDLA